MDKCKLVVRGVSAGLDVVGDCVNAYPFETDLTSSVSNSNGVLFVIEITDAAYNHADIQLMLEPNIFPTTHDMIYGIEPEQALIWSQGVSIAIAELLAHKVTH